MIKNGLSLILSYVCSMLLASAAHAECRKVGDVPTIAFSPQAEAALAEMKISRAQAFRILWRTAMPETQGCWAGGTGNFDGQIVSVGSMQWNFGQGSLQFVLHKYRQAFLTKDAFDAELTKLMPKYGPLLFSDGCRTSPISKTCRDGMLAVQSKGRLSAAFANEINALFESDPMLQIQVDRYLTTLTSVASDLKRLFGDGTPSELRVKWALDTKTQQGSFPKDAHITAMREKVAKLMPAQRHANLLGMVNWYDGLCQFPISEGIRHDCAFNRPAWAQRIDSLYAPTLAREEPEILDLMNLTWLRSVQSQGNGGAYQALTFQRRVTIILGTGSVAGHIFKS